MGEVREQGVLLEARVHGQLQGLRCQQAEESREPASRRPAKGDENGCCLSSSSFLRALFKMAKGGKYTHISESKRY